MIDFKKIENLEKNAIYYEQTPNGRRKYELREDTPEEARKAYKEFYEEED